MQSNEQSKATSDPLDGFRGREGGDYEVLEDELRAWRSLAEEPLNVELVKLVQQKDRLEHALKDQSGPMVQLVNHVLAKLDEATKCWWGTDNPDSVPARGAHIRARACRLLIDWIEETIEVGKQAERHLMMEEEDGQR